VEWTVPCPPLKPYAKTVVESDVPDELKSGTEGPYEIFTGEPLQQPMVFTSPKKR
jgi:hypothetical protein